MENEDLRKQFFKELDHGIGIYFKAEPELNQVNYWNLNCNLTLTLFDENKVKIELNIDNDHHWGDLEGECIFENGQFTNIKYNKDSLEVPSFCFDHIYDIMYIIDPEFCINLINLYFE